MAKQRPSVQKRQREHKKRQRELKKAEKAEQKRERRLNREQQNTEAPAEGADQAPGEGGETTGPVE